jgi:hypothetical protein
MTLLLRASSASVLTSLALLGACGPATPSPDGGTGGTTNPGTGGTGNPGTGGTGNPGTGGAGTGGVANGTGGVGNGTGGVVNGTGGVVNGTGGVVNGTGGVEGGTGGVASTLDANNVDIAAPGATTAENQAYLRIGPTGEIRILNNNWGSEDLGCSGSMFSVFYNADKSFGWTFNRPACGGNNEHPDFPQIEFGIHPFGVGNELATSPEFSSTTLMPKRISEITTASVDIDNLVINLTNPSKWNITFEFWLSETDPREANPAPGAHRAYAELMTFWGWEANRWPDIEPDHAPVIDTAGPAETSNGGKNYKLWVQKNNWANGWRYFQFRDTSGSHQNFDGTIDVKALLTHLTSNYGYSDQLWVTRLEVGSEIDDNTAGTVTLDNITFTVNGESRSAGKNF